MERDLNMLIIMTGLDPPICYFVRVQGLIKKIMLNTGTELITYLGTIENCYLMIVFSSDFIIWIYNYL
jgi:hypothetical protein